MPDQCRGNCIEGGKTERLVRKNMVINDISMDMALRSITALIGPSGCGKSTFIRCLNRMHEVSEGGRVRARC